MDVSKEKWEVVGDFKGLERTELIFDGDSKTAWTLRNETPVDVVIDLGEVLRLKGFRYLPDQGRWDTGIIFNYELYCSLNGKNWGKPISEGEFPNIKNNPVWQEKTFPITSGRFLKFRALSPAMEGGRVGFAEFDVLTE